MPRYLIETHATWEGEADDGEHAIELARATGPDTLDTHVQRLPDYDEKAKMKAPEGSNYGPDILRGNTD